jgi:molybdenum cofactor cytidylyltransferase
MNFALIPAAGKSVRMGRPKLALPLGGQTVLECVLETVRQAGIEHILVVAGPQVPELVSVAEAANVHILQLSEETPDMRATIVRGLCWLEERFHPQVGDSWLLVPADHPILDANVVRHLLKIRRERSEYSIVVPTFHGKRGHPALIDWKHAQGVRAFPAGVGLNVYLRQQAIETLEVPVDSAGILCDLDTPQDYDRLAQQRKKKG